MRGYFAKCKLKTLKYEQAISEETMLVKNSSALAIVSTLISPVLDVLIMSANHRSHIHFYLTCYSQPTANRLSWLP